MYDCCAGPSCSTKEQHSSVGCGAAQDTNCIDEHPQFHHTVSGITTVAATVAASGESKASENILKVPQKQGQSNSLHTALQSHDSLRIQHI